MKIIADQVLILGIITLIGYLAFKLKAISHEVNQGLVRVIMKVTLPLLLFTTVSGLESNGNTLANGLVVLVFSIITVVILYIVSGFSTSLLKLDGENGALHRTHTMFGNIVFLGFPLLDALFPGGKGLLYATMFQLGHDTLLWTWGIMILSKASKEKTKRSWKHLLNLNTLAFALGFVVYFIGLKIPDVIFNTLAGVGHTTIYISMIYVGAVLAQVKLNTLIKNVRSWILSFNRLLLVPIIVGGILYLLKMIGFEWLETDAITVIILQAGMPCMIIVSVIARELGLNDSQATQNIFLTTVLSLGTLPLLYYLIHLVF